MAKPSTNFDPRRLMEQAVDVMRQSRAEPRKDGKATPKVGAVLWHPDGTIQTAHRGELREGDHAEFTILERKNRDRGLDGCKLFATLEPCAPGSRAPHKTPCAERIVLARIKEVWVGIEDPDPLVADKGIRYLEDSGVTVHIFPRDLQKQIQAENQKFLAQAEARARVAEDEPAKPVAISALEQPLKHLSNKWFSPQALHQFREAAEITPRVGSREFGAELVQRGLAAPQRGRLVPTGF
jgi:ATP-dependent DNA helicase RecG